MTLSKREQDVERIGAHFDDGVAFVTNGARQLGKLRCVGDAGIEANITALEDEGTRHLQLNQAVRLTGDFYV